MTVNWNRIKWWYSSNTSALKEIKKKKNLQNMPSTVKLFFLIFFALMYIVSYNSTYTVKHGYSEDAYYELTLTAK